MNAALAIYPPPKGGLTRKRTAATAILTLTRKGAIIKTAPATYAMPKAVERLMAGLPSPLSLRRLCRCIKHLVDKGLVRQENVAAFALYEDEDPARLADPRGISSPLRDGDLPLSRHGRRVHQLELKIRCHGLLAVGVGRPSDSLDSIEEMEKRNLSDLMGLMLVAGGPDVIPARIRWPMHQALHELHDEAGRRGLRRFLPTISIRPSPDVGVRAEGADSGLFCLIEDGVLTPEGEGTAAVLRVTPSARTRFGRELMRLEPEAAALVDYAGKRWAALVATSAKNRSTARRSSGATRASSTPKRLHVLLGSAPTASSERAPVRSTRLATR